MDFQTINNVFSFLASTQQILYIGNNGNDKNDLNYLVLYPLSHCEFALLIYNADFSFSALVDH